MVKKNKKGSATKISKIISTKNGEPSIHLSQKSVFTGSIIAVVIIIIVVGIVVQQNCTCGKEKEQKEEPKKLKQFKASEFSIGRENVREKKLGVLTQKEIEDRLRNTKKERSQASIENVFRKEISSKIKMKENQEGENEKRVWMPPRGVQPGTMVTPPIGYTKTKYANYDRGYGPNKGRASVYGYVPGQSFTNTLVKNSPTGPAYFGPNFSWDDNAPNGLMPPYTNVKTSEKAVASGQSQHDSSNKLKDGITGETWKGDRTDWNILKKQTKENMMKISVMLDNFLKDTIFPNMSRIDIGGGGFRVSSGENQECISLERYYEFVANTISAQMGLEPIYAMEWAQGSNIKLGFENLETSVPDLRKALAWNCAEAPTYTIKYEDVIYAESKMEEVAYTVIWPKDNSVLYVHRMKLK